MSTSTSTGTFQAVIQPDLEYAEVGGSSLRLDLYTPSGAPTGLPTLLYLHGGGWAMGDKSDAAVERLIPIVAHGFAVASANYRLVPSVTYPAPVHDVKAAVRWLRANAAEYGLDPERIALGGASAGGHLASLDGAHDGRHAARGGHRRPRGRVQRGRRRRRVLPRRRPPALRRSQPAREPDAAARADRGVAGPHPHRRRPRARAVGEPPLPRARRRSAAPASCTGTATRWSTTSRAGCCTRRSRRPGRRRLVPAHRRRRPRGPGVRPPGDHRHRRGLLGGEARLGDVPADLLNGRRFSGWAVRGLVPPVLRSGRLRGSARLDSSSRGTVPPGHPTRMSRNLPRAHTVPRTDLARRSGARSYPAGATSTAVSENVGARPRSAKPCAVTALTVVPPSAEPSQ